MFPFFVLDFYVQLDGLNCNLNALRCNPMGGKNPHSWITAQMLGGYNVMQMCLKVYNLHFPKWFISVDILLLSYVFYLKCRVGQG